jgi:hypothetical protein
MRIESVQSRKEFRLLVWQVPCHLTDQRFAAAKKAYEALTQELFVRH